MRRAAALVAVGLVIVAACSSPSPSQRTSWPPILDQAAAVDAAIRQSGVAPIEIGEVVSGTFENLDVMSHHAPGDPDAVARWARLANHAVWRVEVVGSIERKTVVLDAETGEVLSWVALPR